MNDEQPQQPKQPEQPGSPKGIGDIIQLLGGALSNPVVADTIKTNAAQVKQLIHENVEGYEPLIFAYLQSSYPDIYEALSKVESEQPEEKRDVTNGMIPHQQFVDDISELDENGYSMNQISEILSEKYNRKIYPMQVSRILKKLDEQGDEPEPEDKPKPKVNIMAAIDSLVAKRIPATVSKPATIPAPIKFPDVDGMYSNFISTVRWSAVAVLTGVLGFILGRVM